MPGSDNLALVRLGNLHRVTRPVWRDLVRTCHALGVETYVVDDEALRRLGSSGEAVEPRSMVGEEERLLALLSRDGVVVSADPDSALQWAVDRVLAGSEEGAARWARPVDLLLSKRRTRVHCSRRGVDVPSGVEGAADHRVAEVWSRACADVGAEWVVVKLSRSWAGRGVRRFEVDREREREVAAFVNGRDFVVEEWVEGMEVSVEVVVDDDLVEPWGWVVKGVTDRSGHPLLRPRVAPGLPVPTDLAAIVERLFAGLGYRGVAEVDFVIADGRPPLVLEVNPRVSWTSPLIWTARGVSSSEGALRRSVGADPRRVAAGWAAEWPTRDEPEGIIDPSAGWLYKGESGFPDHVFIGGETAPALLATARQRGAGPEREATLSALARWAQDRADRR